MCVEQALKFSALKAALFGAITYSLHDQNMNNCKELHISLFLFLVCGCVHRPPPALPIPLRIIVMSDTRRSGKRVLARIWLGGALAHQSKVKRLDTTAARLQLYTVTIVKGWGGGWVGVKAMEILECTQVCLHQVLYCMYTRCKFTVATFRWNLKSQKSPEF